MQNRRLLANPLGMPCSSSCHLEDDGEVLYWYLEWNDGFKQVEDQGAFNVLACDLGQCLDGNINVFIFDPLGDWTGDLRRVKELLSAAQCSRNADEFGELSKYFSDIGDFDKWNCCNLLEGETEKRDFRVGEVSFIGTGDLAIWVGLVEGCWDTIRLLWENNGESGWTLQEVDVRMDEVGFSSECEDIVWLAA